jgi:tetratricopeptide (TPR) repeat protein
MEEKRIARPDFARKVLPWLVAGGALLLYLLTLNRWVTLESLPYVAQVADWDWALPHSSPLFYLLTYPFRWLPGGWQPVGLNVFAAVCGALTLALLVRSVSLLPHDRTHEQRQRERSENSLLTIRWNWVPPLLAGLVAGFQLTFWEHSIAATGEMLNLLVFAYLIRCLLEFRVDRRQSWMSAFALVYGLGVANNWALIGFFPAFLAAVIWIKGKSFFNFQFLWRTTLFGLAGLSLYLLLPLVWAVSGTGIGFFEVIRSALGAQKAYLFEIPALRNRAFLLSMTSLLPILIMGIRWPTTFGDTSAAGSMLTNFMFRVIHVMFLVACLFVVFDPKFSPRALGLGLPFLTFYYLGALAIGYFSGYVLLVFGDVPRTKSWHRRSPVSAVVNPVMRVAVLVALVAVPVGIVYKNLPMVRANNGQMLSEFAAMAAQGLPEEGGVILSDEPLGLLLLGGHLKTRGRSETYILIHTKALSLPLYQKRLEARYPGRWTNLAPELEVTDLVDSTVLVDGITRLARTNRIYYLHPSFGYYFERLHPQPRGLILELSLYSTNLFLPPALRENEIVENVQFWESAGPVLERTKELMEKESGDASFAATYYSRALNFWGVALQRNGEADQAGAFFQRAIGLNTNNVAAIVNLEYGKKLRGGEAPPPGFAQTVHESRSGFFRTWDSLLMNNGPFDEPSFCFGLGERLAQQTLYRQSAIEFHRVIELEPKSIEARLALANVYLLGRIPENVLDLIVEMRQFPNLSVRQEQDLVQLEAGAYFAQGNVDKAEAKLLEAQLKGPNDPRVMGTLLQMYGYSGRWSNALAVTEAQLQIKPGNPELILSQAEFLLNLSRYEEAMSVLDGLLSQRPNHVQGLLFKGIVHLQTRAHDEALAYFDRALETDKDNVDALLSKGAVHLEKGEYQKAIIPLDRAIELHPLNWAAIRNRAIAHLRMDNLKAAKKDYDQLRRILPRYHVVHYGLGEIAYQRKDVRNAQKHYQLYLQYAPNSEAPELVKEKEGVKKRLDELAALGR